MAIYVKDPEVSVMVDRLVELQKTTKTEVIKQALRHELERQNAVPSLVEIGLEFGRKVRAMGDPSKILPVDKDFIDNLYE